MDKKKRDFWRAAWIVAAALILLLILEAALIRVEGGETVPLLSPLLDFIRRMGDTLLEMFRV